MDVDALDANLERPQHLLASNHVQQLNAWWEVRPRNNLPGTDVEARPVKWTLYIAVGDDLAADEGREHVGAIRLGGEEAVGQMVEHDFLVADSEGLHLADPDLIRTAHGMHRHGGNPRDDG